MALLGAQLAVAKVNNPYRTAFESNRQVTFSSTSRHFGGVFTFTVVELTLTLEALGARLAPHLHLAQDSSRHVGDLQRPTGDLLQACIPIPVQAKLQHIELAWRALCLSLATTTLVATSS